MKCETKALALYGRNKIEFQMFNRPLEEQFLED